MSSLNQYAGNGSFLKKADVAVPIQATIVSTGEHSFDGKPPMLILNFAQPGPKPLAANPTNVRRLGEMFGITEVEQLVGKTIEIFTDPSVEMMGRIVGGLRVRIPSGGQPVQSQQQPAYQQAAPQQPMQQPPQTTEQPPWA